MTYESVKLSGKMRGVNKVNKTRSAKYVDIASYLHCLKRFESLQARQKPPGEVFLCLKQGFSPGSPLTRTSRLAGVVGIPSGTHFFKNRWPSKYGNIASYLKGRRFFPFVLIFSRSTTKSITHVRWSNRHGYSFFCPQNLRIHICHFIFLMGLQHLPKRSVLCYDSSCREVEDLDKSEFVDIFLLEHSVETVVLIIRQ